MKINEKIAFIGVGFMAGSMVDGILRAGPALPENIYCINDAYPDVAREAAERHGITLGTASDENRGLFLWGWGTALRASPQVRRAYFMSPRRVEGGIRGKQMFPPEDRVGGNAAGTDLPQKVARSERMSGDFLCLFVCYLPLRARATLLLSSIESCRRR